MLLRYGIIVIVLVGKLATLLENSHVMLHNLLEKVKIHEISTYVPHRFHLGTSMKWLKNKHTMMETGSKRNENRFIVKIVMR